MITTASWKKLDKGFVEQGLAGGIAGLFGGIAFGLWMASQGALAMIASMMGGSSSFLGLIIHLMISWAIGVSFGVLFSRLAGGFIPSTLWGLVYGFAWWFLGPLTMMPLMMGMGLQWTAAAVAATIPSLVWHLIFGGVMGLSYAALTRAPGESVSRKIACCFR